MRTLSKNEKLGLLIAFFGALIALFTLYFQFFHANSRFNITPLTPPKADHNGIKYIFFLNNSGNTNISIIKQEHKYINSFDNSKNKVISFLNKSFSIPPGTTKQLELNFETKSLYEDEVGEHFYDLKFIDGNGVLKEISINLCAKPSKETFKAFDDNTYTLNYELIQKGKYMCDIPIKIF